MHRATSSNLAVSGQAFGASLDVVPLTSTEASSAVHNPYIVGGWFSSPKKVVEIHVHHSTNNTSPNNANNTSPNENIIAKNRLDTDPQLTQNVSNIKQQTDGRFYGVYLDTSALKFKVGILMEGTSGYARGYWVKTYHGGDLTKDMVDQAYSAHQLNPTAHEWSAPGTTLLDHWYWYKNDIPNLGYHR